MSHFKYKNGELYCESIKVKTIAQKVGTPFYLYSYKTLMENFRALQNAFQTVDPLACFAMKANDNLAVVKALTDQGAGCDIVSLGELKKALKLHIDPHKIVFASVGKTEEEISAAIKAGILFFNVESEGELMEINRIAKRLKKKTRAALRVNPDVEAPTHQKITTGTLKNKFGIDLTTAERLMNNQKHYPFVHLNGLHMHIGSQITTTDAYVKAVRKMVGFIKHLKQADIPIDYFNLGGGFGIAYEEKPVARFQDFAKALVPLLKQMEVKIILEPGRSICGEAGIFVTKALYLKDNGAKRFLIVDSGMNDLMRPTLYDAYHAIIPVKQTRRKKIKMDIVGPICESGDFFAKDRLFPPLAKNELLAVKNAGAYCHVMASNYNVRGRAPEILVKGNKHAVIKKRETLDDLMKLEKVPAFLK
jgi:diaminopimelate decarboxylase